MTRSKALVAGLIVFLAGPVLAARCPIDVRAQITPQNISVVIVLDNSGSMADTDPLGLRFVAARQLVDLLENGDEVAVVLFSEQSEILAGGIQRITDQASKEKVKSAVRGRAPGGETNMCPALHDALGELQKASNPLRFALFLTDGELHPPQWSDMSPERQEQERQCVYGVAGLFGNHKWPLFPISLGSAIDPVFLKKLAENAVGIHKEAPESDRIPAVFQEVFAFQGLTIFDILFRGSLQPGESKNVTFPIHKFVRSMSVFVTYISSARPTVWIVPPGGVALPTSLREAEYDAYSVDAPGRGIWSINIQGDPGAASSVIISSSPRAQVEVEWTKPPPVLSLSYGYPMEIEVKVVGTDPTTGEVLPVEDATAKVVIQGPAGTSSETFLADSGGGVYRGEAEDIGESGSYVLELTVAGDEGTFAQRTLQTKVTVLPAAPTPTRIAQPTAPPTAVVEAQGGDGDGIPLWILIVVVGCVVIGGVGIVTVFSPRFPRDSFIETDVAGRLPLREIQGVFPVFIWKRSVAVGRETDDVPAGTEETVAKLRPRGGRMVRLEPRGEGSEPLLMAPGDVVAVEGIELRYGVEEG